MQRRSAPSVEDAQWGLQPTACSADGVLARGKLVFDRLH